MKYLAIALALVISTSALADPSLDIIRPAAGQRYTAGARVTVLADSPTATAVEFWVHLPPTLNDYSKAHEKPQIQCRVLARPFVCSLRLPAVRGRAFHILARAFDSTGSSWYLITEHTY